MSRQGKMAIEMQKKQEQEWKIAQDIDFSVDLLSATKQHLQFLAVIDQNNWISENASTLQRAIYRYTECWIPLLAKHIETPLFEGPLVVPLDCEWIWHCHRLNPVTYNSDCQTMYGKILDNKSVVSSIQGTSEKQTKVVWEMLYPNESFVLAENDVVEENNNKVTEVGKFTKYDLASATQRQSSFYSEVSSPYMNNDNYLEGAISKYKGFLHLVKRDMEMKIDNFLAPTYDIDLIWHTHQLHPVSYYNDLVTLVGMVMGHDDTVIDKTKGQKLDVGFTTTINRWSDIYGSGYHIIAQTNTSPCGKPEDINYSSFILAQTNISPCGKPGESKTCPCGKSGDSRAIACNDVHNEVSPYEKPSGSKSSPCGKPMKYVTNVNTVSYNKVSPCGKPVESRASVFNIMPKEASPCEKSMENMASPCGKPKDKETNDDIITYDKPSPCGKSVESMANVYIIVQTEASPCGKPMVNMARPCGNPNDKETNCDIITSHKVSPYGKLGESMTSPCGKPAENESNVCIVTDTKPSPCGKPGESNSHSFIIMKTEASPCGKPSVNKASPCGKPSKNKASPCGKPRESNANYFITSKTKVSPCDKPGERNDNAQIVIQTKPSPCSKPNASMISPCGKPGKTNLNTCIMTQSELSPCSIPRENNSSDLRLVGNNASTCIVHGVIHVLVVLHVLNVENQG